MTEIGFAEGPIVVQRGNRFYLRYRKALNEDRFGLASPLVAKRTATGGYFYFARPISHPEWGNLIEVPLAYYRFEDFARHERIFWLDPDGTTHALPIQRED